MARDGSKMTVYFAHSGTDPAGQDRNFYSKLRAGELHLWLQIADKEPAEIWEKARYSLSIEELHRAHAYVAKKDALYFVASRDLLRRVLSVYTKQSSSLLELKAGRYGKPCLAQLQEQGVAFNLSRRGLYSIVAVGGVPDIGVDLETATAGRELQRMVTTLLSPLEHVALQQQTTEQEAMTFLLRAWCRKEAVLKSLGTGLIDDLSSLDVTPDEIDLSFHALIAPLLDGSKHKVYLQDISLRKLGLEPMYCALATTVRSEGLGTGLVWAETSVCL